MLCSKLLKNTEISKRKLLKYVRSNNLEAIDKILSFPENENLLENPYSEFRNHNILIIACNDYSCMTKNDSLSKFNGLCDIEEATIKKLIQHGAKCTSPSTNDHWEPIHYAAICANKKKLSAILDNLTKEEANSLVYCSKHIPTYYSFAPKQDTSYSNNALHILLKYGKRNSKDFRECCAMLVQKGVSLNQTDSNGLTPLSLMKNIKELVDLVDKVGETNKTRKMKILELINLNDQKQFVEINLKPNEADDVDGSEEKLSSCTLLQLCCTKGLTSCVEHLLRSGASPNKTISKNTKSPIMIAIKRHYEDIVTLLLENLNLILPEDILIKIQTKYDNKKGFRSIDKHLKLILEYLDQKDRSKVRRYLLTKDELHRTALHYAISCRRSSENILKLLDLGSPLNKKDIFGYTPLHSIDPQVLEKFLVNCVNLPKEAEGVDNMMYALQNQKEKFQVEINYEALIGGDESEAHESEFLLQMIKIKKLTVFLNHPVISSYLEVKWQKFKWAVYTNLLLYIIAYSSLLFYGFAYEKMAEESNILLLVSLTLIFFREMTQIVLFRLDYFKRVDNLTDLILFGGIIYILAAGWYPTLNNQNLRVAFSVVFLSSTLGIFLQLGNLPVFTIRVIVFRQTCISFCKYMIFYVFPLLAFSFCFYMLRETNEDVFFLSFYDVATMFAGDPHSEYPSKFTTNPIFSHIIYVCFIIVIGIILQNLLIGLAVNDLQEIEKEAEFIDKKERANYITNIERVLFSNHQISSNWIFKNIFRNLLNVCQVFDYEYTLVIEPYNSGCVYLKENPVSKQYIRDESIINLLQNIFKDLTNNVNREIDLEYSAKAICKRLEKIENILNKLDVNALRKQ